MASSNVIREVTSRLLRLLRTGFSGDSGVKAVIKSESDVVSEPPRDVATTAGKVSLWLYQIVENEFLKNQPTARGAVETEERFPPLALSLSYLLTVNTGSYEQDQIVLGRAMQVLYDNARLLLDIKESDQAVELSVVLARRTLEELTRIWDALREPYRLSVCYDVRVVPIDSQRVVRAGRIAERALREEAPSPP